MTAPLLYELRVLSGRQRGATFPIKPGAPLRIGQDWSSDVVLRADSAAAARISLLADESALELQVENGSSQVEEVSIDAGQKMAVGLYVPFSLGDVQLAVGQVGAPQWGALFGNAAPQPLVPAETQGNALQPMQPAAVASARWVRRLLQGGVALVAISAGALTLSWAMDRHPGTPGQQVEQMRQSLHRLGYATLDVEIRDGQPVVTGYLNSETQRAELEQALARTSMRSVRVMPWINEQVTQGVAEVFRLNGIAAQVKSAGSGVVQVHTREANTENLQRAEAVARRDVPGLVKLVSVNDAPPAAAKASPVAADPGKRVAAIVPGDPAYVVTADGTRYFTGAVLPTGHRIQAIQANLVQLERDGQISQLTF